MIVKCSKCHSRFRFPESELTGEGVWLKCGVCKNLFFLENPHFSEPKTAPIFEEKLDIKPEDEDSDSEEGLYELTKEATPLVKEKAGRGKLLTALKGIGIALAILLVTGGVYYYFFPEVGDKVLKEAAQWVPFARQLGLADKEPAAATPSIDFLNVKERFVKNWMLGDMMVIQGVAVNKTDQPASLLKIKAKLLDQSGQFIAESSSYAGDIFSEEELLNLTEQEILAKLANPDGSEYPNRNISPDGSIPFLIVFIKPPAKASEYIVELDSMQGLPKK